MRRVHKRDRYAEYVASLSETKSWCRTRLEQIEEALDNHPELVQVQQAYECLRDALSALEADRP